jgi:hypothetical protein
MRICKEVVILGATDIRNLKTVQDFSSSIDRVF